MRTGQVLGLSLWRGGTLLAGGWTLYRGARFALSFLSLPSAVEVGLSLVVAGLVLVLLSIVLENREDQRARA